MTDKEFRRLRRRGLLQLETQLDEAGSIAEAALRLNGIFETAQQTADQYLYNLRIQCGLEEEEFPLEMDDQDSDENEGGIQPESE